MPADDFERFRWSCFDPSFHAVHDGLDTEALLRLTVEERARAAELILAALPTTADARPIRAAGLLRLEAAVEPLLGRLADEPLDAGREYNRVEAALALHRIMGYLPAIEIILHELRRARRHEEYTVRVAAYALREIGPTRPIFRAVMERLAGERDDSLADILADLLEALAAQERADKALAELQADRAELEWLLVPRYVYSHDSHLAIALGLLKSGAAIRKLRERLMLGTGRDRVRVAVALYRIGGLDPEATLLDVLHRRGLARQFDRLEAIRALRTVPATPRLLYALIDVVTYPEDTYGAYEALSMLATLCAGNPIALALIREAWGGGYGEGWQNPPDGLVRRLRESIR